MNKKINCCIFLVLFFINLSFSNVQKVWSFDERLRTIGSDFTFYTWKQACDGLPPFDENADNPYKTPLTERHLAEQINRFLRAMYRHFMSVMWLDNNVLVPMDRWPKDHFESYIEKLMIPTDAIIAIHGDFHGDVHAINCFIETFLKYGFLDKQNPFKIKSDNFYMLFLGDYVDRGWYGTEVLYTILRLKNENPDRVFMVRGNHEDIAVSVCGYGFGDEIGKKLSSRRLIDKIETIYNMLPLALYVGTGLPNRYDMIQCCHGGIELGVDPRPLLEASGSHICMRIDTLMQENGFAHIDHLPLAPFKHFFKNNKPLDTTNGFMWNDFIVDHNTLFALSQRDGQCGNIFEYGQEVTEQLLSAWSGPSYLLRAIFRGHQHDRDATPMRRRILNEDRLGSPYDAGVGKIWIDPAVHQAEPALLQGVSVVTFSVAPKTGYKWPFHAFGLLKVAPHYKDWRLRVLRILPAS